MNNYANRLANISFETIIVSLFLFLSIVYFFAYTFDLANFDAQMGFFKYALNDHDHYIYLEKIHDIAENGFGYEMNNDLGIAIIYTVLGKIFWWFKDDNFVKISLLFNCVILIFAYIYYAKICEKLALGALSKYTFFLNPYLIYFAQLINKDSLTVFFILYIVYCGINHKYLFLMLMLPIMALVRQQLFVFGVVCLFVFISNVPVIRLLIAYLFISVAAAYLSVHGQIIGDESIGEGFSSYLIALNQSYYIGYLIFNPIRVIQCFYDLFLSFDFLLPEGGVDTAKLLRIPQLMILTICSVKLLSMIVRFKYWLQTPARPLVIAIVAFFIAWLINPTINARYTMLIMPVILLFSMYAFRYGKIDKI